MPYLDLNKIAVVLIFLIILVVIQAVVKRSKLSQTNLDGHNNRAIKIIQTVAVSKFSSASVLECSDSSFLIVSNKNGSPAIIELPKLPQKMPPSKAQPELAN